jgi:pimeloyl-ACP methyl ester carboxylesterase
MGSADARGPTGQTINERLEIDEMATVVGAPAHRVGCSDGATAALLVALRRPDLTRRVVLVAGVFNRRLGPGGDRSGQ